MNDSDTWVVAITFLIFFPGIRLEIVESACPDPPCSLVLVSKQDDKQDSVHGHIRIVPVKDADDMLYLEAGVIEKSKRGTGLLPTLMLMLEKYCANLGYRKLIMNALPDMAHMYLRLGYSFRELPYTMIGSKMMDYSSQCPLSLPYPGWEHYHKPYDGNSSIHQDTRQRNHQSSLVTYAEVGNVEVPSSAGKDTSGVAIKTSSTEKDKGCADKDASGVPSWALGVDGYCKFIKNISV